MTLNDCIYWGSVAAIAIVIHVGALFLYGQWEKRAWKPKERKDNK